MSLHNNPERMWFGTEQKMGWIETPQTGADISSVGMSAESTLLGGGGYVRNSWDSHKTYQFSWGDSAPPSLVSLIQAYRNGSYGRGYLYFHDPMYYGTNLLPKRWADPSMAVNFEAEPLIPDVWPTATPVTSTANNYPVNSATYAVPGLYSSQTNDTELFIPIPQGMVLALGAVFSATNGAALYVRTPAGITNLISMDPAGATVVNTIIRNQPWARLGIRNTFTPGTLTLTAMTARLADAVPAGEGEAFSYTNTVLNPSFEASSGTVEIRRNHVQDPRFVTPANWLITSGTYTVANGTMDVSITGVATSNLLTPSQTGWYTGFTPGSTVSAGYVVENIGPVAVNLRVSFYTGAAYVHGPTVNILPGQKKPVAYENLVVPAGATYMQPRMHTVGDTVGTERLLISQPQSEMATALGRYVDPVVGSGDVDLTASWVGAANASPVVLTGVAVANVSVARGFGVRSTAWAKQGSYSMRLIPSPAATSTAPVAAVILGLPLDATQIVTTYLNTPLTGTVSLIGLARRIATPVVGVQRPNTPGEFEHRFYSPESADANVQIWGGAYGGSDMWVDLLTVVAGNYSGVAFTGDSPGVVWNGTPNASTSTWNGRTPVTGHISLGPWYSGEGHSGARFVGNPTVINYNGVGGGQIGLSCILREVGAWA